MINKKLFFKRNYFSPKIVLSKGKIINICYYFIWVLCDCYNSN